MAPGMFSYAVTTTGPKGFQVSLTHPIHGTHLLGDFCSLQSAETFADAMGEIDGCPSHGAGDQLPE